MPYNIKYVNSLLDNVHGYIRLTEVENEIEKLPVFKRLQDISQLGLTNRIFPCALHNRYTHSLGVMHIADQMALHLNMDEDERQVLRLAGLLHDIGHYPLSHDVESAYIVCNDTHRKKVEPENLNSYLTESKNRIDKLTKKNIPELMEPAESDYHHERIGEQVIKSSTKIKEIIYKYYICKSSKYAKYKKERDKAIEIVVDDICAIITGDANHVSAVFGKRISIMIQLMHSELDADRIDYLLRDSTFSGASYGNFDVGQLIQTITYCEFNGDYIVGVNQKGIGCAEQFLINRYIAYSQVIYHKYTSVLGVILQSVVEWNINNRKSKFVMDDIKQIVSEHEENDNYIGYTDNYLIRHISAINKAKTMCPDTIYNFIECIKNYRALEMEDECICTSTNREDISDNLKKSKVYQDMLNEDEKDVQYLYLFKSLQLTKHKPFELFKADFNESGIDNKYFKSYLMDRLKDGLAVIEEKKDKKGETILVKEPYLLVDSDRSMIKSIYGLTYCVLRKYNKKQKNKLDF